MVEQAEIKGFLTEANRKGYAAGEEQEIPERKIIKEADGSTTIFIEIGDFKFHDNYFGGEPYGGREIIFYQERPVWMMVYYGSVDPSIPVESIYPFLMKVLSQAPEKLPVRGPTHMGEGSLTYENVWEGNFGKFHGKETISQSGKIVYSARYIGGLVDQRKE